MISNPMVLNYLLLKTYLCPVFVIDAINKFSEMHSFYLLYSPETLTM